MGLKGILYRKLKNEDKNIVEEKKTIVNDKFNPKLHVKEIKCKCNQCNKVWHYLESDKKQLQSQATWNALYGCGTCGSPWGILASNKAIDTTQKVKTFDKCPNCGSTDVIKSEIFYKKQ